MLLIFVSCSDTNNNVSVQETSTTQIQETTTTSTTTTTPHINHERVSLASSFQHLHRHHLTLSSDEDSFFSEKGKKSQQHLSTEQALCQEFEHRMKDPPSLHHTTYSIILIHFHSKGEDRKREVAGRSVCFRPPHFPLLSFTTT